MADLVLSALIQDNMTAGANAATAALNKLADASDNVSTEVTKAGRSAASLVNQFDPATKALNNLTKAQNDLASGTVTLNAKLASGGISQTQYNSAIDGLSQKVQVAKQTLAAIGDPINQVASSSNASGQAVRQLGIQFVQLGSGIATGQPILQSFIQQGHQVVDVALSSGTGIKGIGSALAGMITPLTAGLAALGAAGVAIYELGANAETSQRNLLALQQNLRASRDDYTSMAAEATAAAKAVAASGVASLADASAAAKSFVSLPNFQGSTQQIENLINMSSDLAVVMGTSVPDAAAKLTTALQDPAKEASDLANVHFKGFNQALADSVTLQAQAGDKAGATARVLDTLKASTQGATQQGLTPLQTALRNLGAAFSTAGTDGESFGSGLHQLGDFFDSVATKAVSATTAVVGWTKSLSDWLEHHGQTTAYTGPSLPAGANLPDSATMDTINTIAQGKGYGSQIGGAQNFANIFSQQVMLESGGHQYNPDGSLKTSSAGAVGLAGLKPSTASGLGFDANVPSQNLQAGESYLDQLLTKYNGNVGLAVAAYNWGPGNVDAFLAGTKNSVPNETTNYVQKVTGHPIGDYLGGQNVAQVSLAGTAAAGSAYTSDGGGWDNTTYGMTNGGTSSASDTAVKLADSMNTTAESAAKLQADLTVLLAGQQALAKSGDTTSLSYQKITQAIDTDRLALQNALTPQQALTKETQQQVSDQAALAAAYAQGATAVAQVTNLQKAENDARHTAGVNIQAQAAQYDALTAAQTKLADAQELQQQNNALQYAQAELSTLGESADQRARELAMLQESQKLLTTRPDIEKSEYDQLVANAGKQADITSEIQRQQQAATDLSDAFGQIADQLGSSIEQAFIGGSGAAVNFGNVARGVLTSVLQEVAKFAIINPIENSIAGGQHRTTLGDILGVAGSVASVSGDGSITDQTSTFDGGTVAATSTSSSTSSSSQSWLQLLGLAGTAKSLFGGSSSDLLSSIGLGGLGSDIKSVLGTSTGIGTATYGTLLGGAGLGIGAGSLLTSLIGKNQLAGEIGSGAGSLAGAALGSIVPGVGTVIGGILGGVLGSGAGLFGPGKPNSYAAQTLTAQNGQLSLGAVQNQVQDASVLQQLESEVADTNQFLQQFGIAINGFTGLGQFGNSKNGNLLNPDLYAAQANGSSTFSTLSFTSGDKDLDSVLNNKSYSNLTDLENAVTAVETFVDQTKPALIALGQSPTMTGSLTTQITNLNNSFQSAIATAQSYGMATDDLTAAWMSATQQANDAVTQTLAANDVGYTSAGLHAQATISGSDSDAEAADLYDFETSGHQAQVQLQQQLVSIYGDTVTSTALYADQMGQLVASQNEQRLAIEKEYQDKATAAAQATAQAQEQAAEQAQAAQDALTQTASQGVQNILDYVTKLQTSTSAPTSAWDKYSLSSQQFSNDYTKAMGGDWDAYQALTGDADTFLQQSQSYNGTGQVYTQDFNWILQSLKNIGTLTPDTLTASVYRSTTETQTQTLVESQADLGAKLDKIIAQIQQGNSKPGRLT